MYNLHSWSRYDLHLNLVTVSGERSIAFCTNTVIRSAIIFSSIPPQQSIHSYTNKDNNNKILYVKRSSTNTQCCFAKNKLKLALHKNKLAAKQQTNTHIYCWKHVIFYHVIPWQERYVCLYLFICSYYCYSNTLAAADAAAAAAARSSQQRIFHSIPATQMKAKFV